MAGLQVECEGNDHRNQLKAHTPGLTVRQTLEKLSAMQLLDVWGPGPFSIGGCIGRRLSNRDRVG